MYLEGNINNNHGLSSIGHMQENPREYSPGRRKPNRSKYSQSGVWTDGVMRPPDSKIWVFSTISFAQATIQNRASTKSPALRYVANNAEDYPQKKSISGYHPNEPF
jgi:hypothetical protein